MGTFKKGLFLGGLLGAGLMWLSTSQKGKQVRDQMLDNATDIYTDIKTRVLASDDWRTLTKSKYIQLVKQYVDQYAIDNGLAEHVRNMVVKVVSEQWRLLEREIHEQIEKKK